MKFRALLSLGVLLPALASADPLTRATITEVVKEVSVIAGPSRAPKPARVREIFAAPEVLRTGAESRAELVAEDRTITRVGADTLFSFEPGQREIQLQRGSVLFHSPAGKGGGTIRTAAATAAVLGTTLIVVATRGGGFKVLVLEGKGSVRAGRATRKLTAGQMTFMLPGGRLGPVYTFQLSTQVEASRLVNGFRSKLASQVKIDAAITKQNAMIAKGKLLQTGLLAGEVPGEAYAVVARDVLQETLATDVGEVATAAAEQATRFANAASSDAVVNTPNLDPARIFTLGSPDLAEVDSTLGIAGTGAQVTVGNVTDGTLFIARNTALATPAINLQPYAGPDLIQFVSLENLRVQRSVTIGGGGSAPVSLLAGGTITNAPGSILTVRAPRLEILALGSSLDPAAAMPARSLANGAPLALTNFGVQNPVGDIALLGPSMQFNQVGLAANRDLTIRSEGSLQMRNALTGNPLYPSVFDNPNGAAPPIVFPPSTTPNRRGVEAGRDLAVSARRNVTVQRVDFSADRILIDAGGSLTINQSRLSNAAFSATTGRVALRAGSVLNVTNGVFQAADVAMAARTINLRSVGFAAGSRVVLDSALGQLAPSPNQNQPSRPGFVNFLSNVTYGGAPAEQQVGSGIIIK